MIRGGEHGFKSQFKVFALGILRYLSIDANRTVLIAGAGYVSRPVGDILVRHGVKVIYGCRNIESAQRLAKQVGAGALAIALDVKNKEQLEEAIKNVDLIVRYSPTVELVE